MIFREGKWLKFKLKWPVSDRGKSIIGWNEWHFIRKMRECEWHNPLHNEFCFWLHVSAVELWLLHPFYNNHLMFSITFRIIDFSTVSSYNYKYVTWPMILPLQCVQFVQSVVLHHPQKTKPLTRKKPFLLCCCFMLLVLVNTNCKCSLSCPSI